MYKKKLEKRRDASTRNRAYHQGLMARVVRIFHEYLLAMRGPGGWVLENDGGLFPRLYIYMRREYLDL